ncbi:GNAT family N-acetyltransferase [Deinococcus peraridilitoris]|uniref:Acetyltransferase, N-acetylglutamate synthase n=1 Tax=Deinococcus peraridilitoris (strain DSM 19664 / LMG 22246 / CIP 109416 / KR-200) TaxID=937777 RepID=L0A3G4_DEIPD|nr:GNAT family N-acetyltransferase [Deinococcus peraridilitoris]AFZ68386.1 acetyltransferase, N-acetylglutamate synthase [Deinococcus peraridilitoris DSM 19664]
MTLTLERDTVTKIRPAAHHELDLVKRLLEAVGLHSGSVTMQGATFWIARRDGESVGVIGLEHGEGASLLRSTAVLPQARGTGVGRALVQSALTLATLRGDRAVYLFSSDAGPFWQRYGFQAVPVSELARALPGVPQVESGQCKGWLHEELAWRKDLEAQA